MTKRCLNFILTILVVVVCSQVHNKSAFAQDNSSSETEVYLEFSYQGVINSIVISYYKDNEFYLPVSELFSLFQIDHTMDGLQITGRFGVKQVPYTIDLENNVINYGDKTYQLAAEDYLVRDLDTYLRIEFFKSVFNLDFSVDFNNLALRLQTVQELPAIEEMRRQQRRRLTRNDRFSEFKYPLRYGRETPFLDGGFLDYSLRSRYRFDTGETFLNFWGNVGVQVYGGDLQGAVLANVSPNFNNFDTQNLRWNYIVPDRDWLTRIVIGQTRGNGVTSRNFTGIRLTNEPVEPRRLFNEFEIQGNTIPEAEVELYVNEGLADFQESDPDGYYRFLLPVSYGITRVDLRIYGPTGQIIRRSNQIQVPFNFQPAGEFNYNLNLGQLDNSGIRIDDQNYLIQSSGSYGINDWLTASGGIDYYHNINDNVPVFSTSLSSRFLNYYILTVNAVPQAYYRGQLNAIYPNSSSFRLDYTDFTTDSPLFNIGNEDKNLNLTFSYPLYISGRPINLRANSFSRIRQNSTITSLRLDASTRLGPFSYRLGYSNQYLNRRNITGITSFFETRGSGILNNNITFTIPRGSVLPDFLEGSFLSASANYLLQQKQLTNTNFAVAGRLFKTGRFQLSYGRNYLANFNRIALSISVDFNNIRSTSQYRTISSGGANFEQRISGSVGYDSNFDNFVFSNRDQVGRSGAAVRLFVDNNNNGSYEEFVDNLIDDNAVRVQRSSPITKQKDGIFYLTNLQPYFYLNMEMNKAVIENPMLVPEFDKFGLISDPNRFKRIEIPFYLSGIMEGQVVRLRNNGEFDGVGGLKLILTSTDANFRKEIRTFSDGNFYDYELPPGNYELRIAQSQLDILNVNVSPQKIEFEVEALAEGDFVEGLRFELYPKDAQIPDENQPADTLSQAIIADYQNAPSFMSYEEWLAQNVPVSLNLLVKAQKAFYNKNFQQAIAFINQSLELFETAQGYALKGSLYYLNGNEERAMANWRMAMELDPDIYIPSMELLQQEVNTSSTDTSSIE